MDESLECQILYPKNLMSFPDDVDNILTYDERENLRGRPFKDLKQFDLSIRRMLHNYESSFIFKAKNCFKIEHDKVNNIPFELELQDLGTTSEIWANDIHLDTPKHTLQGVYSVKYYDAKDES